VWFIYQQTTKDREKMEKKRYYNGITTYQKESRGEETIARGEK